MKSKVGVVAGTLLDQEDELLCACTLGVADADKEHNASQTLAVNIHEHTYMYNCRQALSRPCYKPKSRTCVCYVWV